MTPNPFLVPFDGSFCIADAPTKLDDAPKKKANEEALAEQVAQLIKLQPKLYADGRYALLLVFQAMDAAGKDGTIRAVLSGLNPAGVQIHAFKAPSDEELRHDFLWRLNKNLPPRGIIGVFNRSHYEEVLVVKVNPHFLDSQRLPEEASDLDELWAGRYRSIRDTEQHWARSGVVILKFFLHVSEEEQNQRFLDRIDDPEANWKFSAGDVKVSRDFTKYMAAYQDALNETSRPWAPWYAIPADSKSYMRRAVAEIVTAAVASLPLRYPELSDEERAEMMKLRAQLAKQ